MTRKAIRWGAGGLAVVLAGMQMVRPERTNPDVTAANTLQAQYEVPAEVGKILDRACLDCHSHRTRWPWYSQVAPVSWMLAEHVADGRRHMNMDDFNEEMSVKDICQELRVGSMPLKGYALLHPESKLSGAEIQAVCGWAGKAQPK